MSTPLQAMDSSQAILKKTIALTRQDLPSIFTHTVEHAGYGAILSRLMTGLNRAITLDCQYDFEIASPYQIEPLFDMAVKQDTRMPTKKQVEWDFLKDTWNAPSQIRASHQYPACPPQIDAPLTRHQWNAVLAYAICGTPSRALQTLIDSTKEALAWGAYDFHIGLHIRRGDKNSEAPYIPTSIYIEQVKRIISNHPHQKIAIFLASDDAGIFDEVTLALGGIPVLWDLTEDRFNNYNAGMVEKDVALAEKESFTAAKNICLLGACDYVIGMSTAQFTWIGGLLAIFQKGLDTSRQIMIDPITHQTGHWASAFGFDAEGKWPLKILHLSPDENGGGAAKAAYRIHCALKQSNINSQMLVLKKASDDPAIYSINAGIFRKIQRFIYKKLNQLRTRTDGLLVTLNPTLHSFGKTSRGLVDHLNQCDADVIHLHWIIGMLSIQDIGRITKPLVWTFHDMWAFCGGEHYAENDAPNARFRAGYLPNNRPAGETGPDLNRATWQAKMKSWKNSIQVIAPSQWMARCTHNSILMHEWPVYVIPNTLDTQKWQPMNKTTSRKALNLPENSQLICFGAMGGAQTHLKGFDLLCEALNQLRGTIPNLEIIIFGQNKPEVEPDLGFPLHYTGHLSNEEDLRRVYSAADVFIIPSRMDNLPNTGVESMACGTPVVAFNTGGLKDIVTHQITGWLAEPFDAHQLAQGIKWVLENPARHNSLCQAARAFAETRFSYGVVAQQHSALYQQLIKN